MSKKLLSAQDIVSKFNISFQKVNHYTTLGLLIVVAKDDNRRMYNEAEVSEALKKIQVMTTEGYPLRLIRKKLEEEKG